MVFFDFVIGTAEEQPVRFTSNDLAGNAWQTLRIGILVSLFYIFLSYVLVAMKAKNKSQGRQVKS
jgi:hypothetical protein